MTFWHDQQTNSLVYDTPLRDRILPYLHGGTPLHNGYMACPANLYNCQVLAYCKLPVIPIVDQTYDWPIKKPWRPREQQKLMTNFMVMNPRSFNLSDMGTMKTLATLWAADYVMQQHPCTKAIICAPLSILQRVWGDALTQHFLGRRTYTIVYGDAKKRRKLLAQNTDFYIINHDGVGIGAKSEKSKLKLEGLANDIATRQDIGICIIDEASAYRDGTTRRHRIARAVLAHKPYFWPLTGTPTANGPLDAHGLARLVNGAFGESFHSYKNRVMYRLSQFVWVPRVGAHEQAYQLLQPSIRFEMRECTDVPPCTEQMRDVELSAEQQKLYKELKRDLQLMLEKGRVDVPNEAALRGKLIQICAGAIYGKDGNGKRTVTYLDCAPRFAELRAVIAEASRKVVIFTPLTSVVHMIYDNLKEYSRAYINGDVPTSARNEILSSFLHAKDPHILIVDPATTAHGINEMVAASVEVWWGCTDRTELYLQGKQRVDRPGQIGATTIVQLASTPVEREIFKRAASSQSMQGAILDLVRAA